MKTVVRYILGTSIAALIVAAPIAYYIYRHRDLRNFAVVRDGVLYRSGQLSRESLKEVIQDHDIKTVITFRCARKPGDPHPDIEEEKYVRKIGLNYYRLPPKGWYTKDGVDLGRKSTKKFCEIVKDPKHYPILVHCFAGKHRTGAYVAVYRMECEGWSNERAIEEMKRYGYDNIEEHKDLLGFLTQY